MEKKNYTYLLRCGDGSLYCGWTNDLLKRIKSHGAGEGGKYTRARLPVYITYIEEFDTKEEAMSREWHIKRLSRKQKEALAAKSGTVQLRPHHLLCIQLFEGKGYSPEFTENMARTIRRLEDNPDIFLTCCSDTLCSCCPHRGGGNTHQSDCDSHSSGHNSHRDDCNTHRGEYCNFEEKIMAYDSAVLEKCGLYEGQLVKWEDARALAHERILAAGRLREVCRECQWGEICYKKQH